LKEPAPNVGVAALGESAISLSIKPWVNVDDFVLAQSEIYQAVIERFKNEQIEIPGPHRAVRLINQPL